MPRTTANLDEIAEKIRNDFAAKDAAREKALRMCREAIRHSANAIRAVHRGEFENTREALGTASSLLQNASAVLADHGQLLYSGFMHDSQKEYAEGCITLALAVGEGLPSLEELGVGSAAYLHGLAEAVGEMRRYLLDTIRRGDLSRCESILAEMDEIYTVLVTMDFPDALTYGLRRATDVTRGILEKTRGDLTVIIKQKELEEKLNRQV